ncbi:MAG: DUF1574 family protein [Leptospiraceae bacterium]|nr:DUF1574 family protein [Leptospiraceae bacterium]
MFREKKDIYDFSVDDFLDSYKEFSNKDKINSGTNSDQDVNATLDFVINAKKLMEMKENKNSGWMHGIKEHQESPEQIEINRKYTEWVIQSFFQNFQMDLTSSNLFKKVLREAKEKNINLVLYRPRTHEELKSSTKKYTKGEAEWLLEVTEIAKQYSIPFYDFEKPGALECDYFADTSHLSKTCFPEVVEKIILESK